MRDFVTTTLGSLFGNKSDKTGPNWEGTGYAYSGDKVSQRDIERLVSVLAFSFSVHALAQIGCASIQLAMHVLIKLITCLITNRLCIHTTGNACADQTSAISAYLYSLHVRLCVYAAAKV